MDAGGTQLDVVQGERRVVGRHGPRGRVTGLIVAVGIVLLNLAVVLEDVGRQLDCGDSATVSDIFFTLCAAHEPRGEPASRKSARAQNKDGRTPATTGSSVLDWFLGFDWVSGTGRGGGMRRKEQDKQIDNGYRGYGLKAELEGGGINNCKL